MSSSHPPPVERLVDPTVLEPLTSAEQAWSRWAKEPSREPKGA